MKNYISKVVLLPNDTNSDYRREFTFYVDGNNKQEAEAVVTKRLYETILYKNNYIRLHKIKTTLVKGKKDSNDLRRELGLQWSDGWNDGFLDIRNRTFVVFSHVVDMFRKYAYLPNFLVTARSSDSAFQQAESYLYSRKLRYYEDTYNATCTDRQDAIDDTLALPDFKKDAESFYSKEGPTQGKIDIRYQK